MNSERGYITLPALILCLTLSLFLILYIERSIHLHRSLSNQYKLILCLKSYAQINRYFIEKINQVNFYIKSAKYGEYLSLLSSIVYPPAIALSKTLKKSSKGLKIYQQFLHASLMKNILSLKVNECREIMFPIKSPYNLKRSKRGLMELKTNKWTRIFIKNKTLIIMKISSSDNFSKVETVNVKTLLGGKLGI